MTKFAYLIEPPFNYLGADGAPTGCDVELARTVLSMVGAHEFEPVETEFSQLLPGLVDGRWRMTTGLFATDERKKLAAFSRPIWALSDGLLVRKGNPLRLNGYRSAVKSDRCRLAVIRDQMQHRVVLAFGATNERILVFETYGDAAKAVLDGRADAYASVERAHRAYIEQHPGVELDVVAVAKSEKAPAFGSFGFNKSDQAFKQAVDDALMIYLGSSEHRAMMRRSGFSDAEIDRVAP